MLKLPTNHPMIYWMLKPFLGMYEEWIGIIYQEHLTHNQKKNLDADPQYVVLTGEDGVPCYFFKGRTKEFYEACPDAVSHNSKLRYIQVAIR